MVLAKFVESSPHVPLLLLLLSLSSIMAHTTEQKDVDNITNELDDAYYQESHVRSLTSSADTLVHSLTPKGYPRREIGSTMGSKLLVRQVPLRELLSDMNDVILLTTNHTRHDDAALRQWSNSHHCWFNFCIPAKPQRRVPPQAAKMSQAMKEELQDWGEEATRLASCMTDINKTCYYYDMEASSYALQYDFDQVDEHWTNYIRQLCEYHGWDICKTETVLMELRALDNPSCGTYLQLSFCIMAFIGVFVGAALSRRRVWKPDNEMYQTLLSSARL